MHVRIVSVAPAASCGPGLGVVDVVSSEGWLVFTPTASVYDMLLVSQQSKIKDVGLVYGALRLVCGVVGEWQQCCLDFDLSNLWEVESLSGGSNIVTYIVMVTHGRPAWPRRVRAGAPGYPMETHLERFSLSICSSV